MPLLLLADLGSDSLKLFVIDSQTNRKLAFYKFAKKIFQVDKKLKKAFEEKIKPELICRLSESFLISDDSDYEMSIKLLLNNFFNLKTLVFDRKMKEKIQSDPNNQIKNSLIPSIIWTKEKYPNGAILISLGVNNSILMTKSGVGKADLKIFIFPGLIKSIKIFTASTDINDFPENQKLKLIKNPHEPERCHETGAVYQQLGGLEKIVGDLQSENDPKLPVIVFGGGYFQLAEYLSPAWKINLNYPYFGMLAVWKKLKNTN